MHGRYLEHIEVMVNVRCVLIYSYILYQIEMRSELVILSFTFANEEVSKIKL